MVLAHQLLHYSRIIFFADDTTMYETFDLKTRTFDTVVQNFKDKLMLFNN